MPKLFGHHAARRVLEDALAGDRVHHAWVFAGPRGVGKLTTARAFAAQLLDPEATGRLDDGGFSEARRLIDAGTHPDLHVVTKELALHSEIRELRKKKLTNIPIDLLREHLLGGQIEGKHHDAKVFLTPMLGHGKVFIIDEAELIDGVGQGALLKTLEEPPPATFLILVTSRPERLLPTIHSRCQHVRFGTLDAEDLAAWFDSRAFDLDHDRRRWVQAFCAGSPGLAERALEANLYEWHCTITPDLDAIINGHFPIGLGATLGALVDAHAEARLKSPKVGPDAKKRAARDRPHDTEKQAVRNRSKEAENKDAARLMFMVLAHEARRRMTAACRDELDPTPWLERIDLVAEAERAIDANVNQKQVFENLVAQWSRLPQAMPA